jgi:hypothetical protein
MWLWKNLAFEAQEENEDVIIQASKKCEDF